MPLKVILDKKTIKSTWSAVGSFSTASGTIVGSADVLVKEVAHNELQLILDAKQKISKINNREVELYSNVKPVTVPYVKKGIEVVFEKISVTLKKL